MAAFIYRDLVIFLIRLNSFALYNLALFLATLFYFRDKAIFMFILLFSEYV